MALFHFQARRYVIDENNCFVIKSMRLRKVYIIRQKETLRRKQLFLFSFYHQKTLCGLDNQVPHLTQDTTWESDKTQENITCKRAKRSALSQQFDHKAAMNRQENMATQNINNTNDPQKKHRLVTESKPGLVTNQDFCDKIGIYFLVLLYLKLTYSLQTALKRN